MSPFCTANFARTTTHTESYLIQCIAGVQGHNPALFAAIALKGLTPVICGYTWTTKTSWTCQ